MKLIKVELFKLAIPMRASFTTSFGKIRNKHTLIVRLTDESGVQGYGEAAALNSPLYLYETTDTCSYIIKDFIAPRILGKQLKTPKSLIKSFDPIRGHNFAKTGVETAFWHLLSVLKEKSLYRLLGGLKKKIPVGESVGIKPSKNALLKAIHTSLERGYKRIKLKIQPGWDLQIVDAVRAKFGNIPLMVDANSAYTLKDIPLFKKLDSYDLMMIEQPLAHDDIIDHARLQKEINTPICLDESILSAQDARKAIEIGSCKIINIKPGRVGGLLESIKVHDLCKEHGIPVWCGGMLETGIGRAFNLAIASLPNFKLPADMSPPLEFYKEDLISPTLKLRSDGYIDVPSEPGLGFEVLESRIKKYTIEKVTIR